MSEPTPEPRPPRVYHPLLFAAFPVLFLFAQNLHEGVTLGDLTLPLLITLGITAVLFAVGTKLLGSASRAGLILSGWVLLFFSYGHVFLIFRHTQIGGLAIGRHRVLMLVWAVLGIGVLLLGLRLRDRLSRSTRPLNVVAAVLVALNIGTIALDAVREAGRHRADIPSDQPVRAAPAGARDVYYVIFDRYAGAPTLQKYYGYDNEPFLDQLRSRGFFVPEAAWGNYPRSTMSMASSLNMSHLHGRVAGNAQRQLGQMYDAPAAAKFLKQRGYRYVNVGTWWSVTRNDPYADLNLEFDAPSRFATILVETTMLQPLNDRFRWLRGFEFRRTESRRVPWQFDQVAAVARDPAPTFTFAHFLVPHEPFIFEADGSFLKPVELNRRPRKENYVAQLRYVNAKVLELLDTLLAVPEERRPIILLQSDEGPEPLETDQRVNGWGKVPTPLLEQKMRIFMASYFPGEEDTGLYEGITPVNSFRVLFNTYFDAGLPLLPDQTFVWQDGRYQDVTDRLRALDPST